MKVPKHIAVEENRYFRINRTILIEPEYLFKLSPHSVNILLDISNFFYKESRYDNWISIPKECENFKLLKNEKRFMQYTITEKNKETYMKLVRTLYSSLKNMPDMKLFSYTWLELIPSHLLMEESSLKQLLYIIEGIVNGGNEVNCDNLGIIANRIDLPVEHWLHFNNDSIKMYNKFLTWFKLADEGLDFFLSSGGYFSSKISIEGRPIQSKLLLEMFKVYYSENIIQKLPMTVDSEGNIMLGSYIWGDFGHIYLWRDKFFLFVEAFEYAVKLKMQDRMRNICGLCNKTLAVKLVRTMNDTLSAFADKDIFSEKLKVLPTDLWVACNKNEETYEKAIKLLQALNEKKINWFLQINGNIKFEYGLITVTMTDLLSLCNNPEKFQENIECLRSLINELETMSAVFLVCFDEIEYVKYGGLKQPNVHSTKVPSYHEIILFKKQLIEQQKIEKVRIEPNGTFIINDHLWMKAKHAVQFNISTLSKNIRKLFPHTKFQMGAPEEKIYVSVLTSPDKQLFDYCRDVCQLIQEAYPEDIKIEYVIEKNMFVFNGVLSIHPRSFIHLQDLEKVVEVLKKFKMYKKNCDQFRGHKEKLSKARIQQRKNELEVEERRLCKELALIKKAERIEFELMKETFFKKLGEILLNPNVANQFNFVPVINENHPTKYFNAVKGFQIQGEFIFQNGSSLGFININKETGRIGFEYKDDQIIDALFLATKLNKKYRCKGLFDFQSLVEIVRAYPNFKARRNEKMEDLSSCINLLLSDVEKQQNVAGRKHRFYNPVKGLHHWLKHSDGFENLEDYFNKMNEFFDTANYGLEIDTQNGEFITRHYTDENYIGFYGIAHGDSGKSDYVASFWSNSVKKTNTTKAAKKEVLKPMKIESNLNATYLVITDTNFLNFKSAEEVSFNKEIIIKTFSRAQPNLLNIQELIKFQSSEKVKKVLLFLSKTLQNKIVEKISKKSEKGKSWVEGAEKDFSLCFKEFATVCQETFSKSNKFILCYPEDFDLEKVEAMKVNCNFEFVQIENSLLEKMDANEIKNFVESKLSIDDLSRQG